MHKDNSETIRLSHLHHSLVSMADSLDDETDIQEMLGCLQDYRNQRERVLYEGDCDLAGPSLSHLMSAHKKVRAFLDANRLGQDIDWDNEILCSNAMRSLQEVRRELYGRIEEVGLYGMLCTEAEMDESSAMEEIYRYSENLLDDDEFERLLPGTDIKYISTKSREQRKAVQKLDQMRDRYLNDDHWDEEDQIDYEVNREMIQDNSLTNWERNIQFQYASYRGEEMINGYVRDFSVTRLYINVRPSNVALCFSELMKVVEGFDFPFQCKIRSKLKRHEVGRTDMIVLYCPTKEAKALRQSILKYSIFVRDHLRKEIQKFALPVYDDEGLQIPGIAIASSVQHREGTVRRSFTQKRADLIEEVMKMAQCAGLNLDDDEFSMERAFQDACRRNSINPVIPALNEMDDVEVMLSVIR